MALTCEPIGVIRSPFERLEGMPIQPASAVGVRGTVEVFEPFAAALRDLDGFSHIILLYHFHRAGRWQPLVTPFLDREPRGLFATRAPTRPNPIGLSVVRLLSVDGHVLHIENVDVVDSTPLLDIKPYVPAFDRYEAERTGWMAAAEGQIRETRSDNRFAP